jgi:hypothetical protein
MELEGSKEANDWRRARDDKPSWQAASNHLNFYTCRNKSKALSKTDLSSKTPRMEPWY